MIQAFVEQQSPQRHHPLTVGRNRIVNTMQFQIIVALCGIVNVAILAAPTESLNSLPGSAPYDIPHTRPDRKNEHVDNPAHFRRDSDIAGSETVNATGAAGPSLVMNNFYMCCLYDNVSAPILNYAPPYACIYGPSDGSCPPVNFPKPWLCTYQAGWTGGVVSTALLTVKILPNKIIIVQSCSYRP